MPQSTFLVVDDDTVLCDRLALALTDRGYTVFSAYSYAEALEVLASSEPTYVVLDLRLRDGKSGLDILQEIVERNYASAVVLLTGFGSIPVALSAARLGIVDLLQKPATVDTILKAFGLDAGESHGTQLIDKNEQRVRAPARKSRELIEAEVPSLKRMEWEYIQRTLHFTDGNISHASRLLGLPRRTLHRKLLKPPSIT